MSNGQQFHGGLPVDYKKLRPRKLPMGSPELDQHVFDWIIERRMIIQHISEEGRRYPGGKLDWLSLDMVSRWAVIRIGNSPTAWMERSMTSAAMLQDYRSLRFGRRVHASNDNMEEYELGYAINEPTIDGYQPLSPAEFEQALIATVFAREWQRYLGTLLILPPGKDPPPNCAFPSTYSKPDELVSRVIAELAHCRPCGAFFKLFPSDEWAKLGGRNTCRMPLHCPHCHARNASRLVNRVLEGPWAERRSRRRRLALVRLVVSTEELGLGWMEQDEDRDSLGFGDWLRGNVDHFTADPGDETMIRNIRCQQSMEHTLTRVEVRAAKDAMKRLRERCVRAGIVDGICVHSIGPKDRNFQHELTVVGELGSNPDRFIEEFGTPASDVEHGQAVEYILFATGHRGAVRLALAGSAFNFDMDQVGAQMNALARSRCYKTNGKPRGLRGALAWQPLFLLSGNSFWSRWKVLREMRFKGYQAFGTWKQILTPDRLHKTKVQRNPVDRKNNDGLATGANWHPVHRLRRMIKNSNASRTELAQEARVSKAAVSQFVNHGIGSQKLQQNLRQALHRLDPAALGISQAAKPRFPNPDSVENWLRDIGQNRSWLAVQMGCHRSKVTQLFKGRMKWTRCLSQQIESIADRIAVTTSTES